MPRIVLAGGGTGGHVFPALAVADELRRRRPDAEITFVGSARGIENRLVPQAGYSLRTLRVSGFQGAGVAGRFTALVAAAWGVARCVRWMVARRPDVVIGVGGFASGPAVFAAAMLRVPTMVMEQNHHPGATNRWLAPRVDAVCAPSASALRRLGGRGYVTGNPVRPAFAAVPEVSVERPLSLLVFGGSRGARSINHAVVEALPALARLEPPPVIVHQTGAEDFEGVAEAYRRQHGLGRHDVLPFLDDMPARLAEASLAICRAGATTLAELAAAGRPAILIPFPFAADDHQRLNAEEVAAAGAAVVLHDRDLSGAALASTVAGLVADRERLVLMGRAARSLARPDAASRIADLAEALADGRPLPGGDDVS